MKPIESIDGGMIDFFGNAPVIDLDIPDFDEALDRAVANKNDALAFTALTTHLERAKDSGDLERLYEMSMVIGATACMHDHMREFSDNYDVMEDHDEHLGHSHEHDKDKTKEEKEKSKKKKKRSRGWLTFFDEN